MKRIGALVIGNADVPSFQKELREGLSELGRIEGRHYVIELRSANGQLSRLAELAAELVRLKVDVDEGAIIDGLQKVANRITLGVILAAMIIGAAMLMRVDTSFRILGYPGLAMLFFLAAACGGAWMAFVILKNDHTGGRRVT